MINAGYQIGSRKLKILCSADDAVLLAEKKKEQKKNEKKIKGYICIYVCVYIHTLHIYLAFPVYIAQVQKKM
jgi:predicted RNase H-like nuclease